MTKLPSVAERIHLHVMKFSSGRDGRLLSNEAELESFKTRAGVDKPPETSGFLIFQLRLNSVTTSRKVDHGYLFTMWRSAFSTTMFGGDEKKKNQANSFWNGEDRTRVFGPASPRNP